MPLDVCVDSAAQGIDASGKALPLFIDPSGLSVDPATDVSAHAIDPGAKIASLSVDPGPHIPAQCLEAGPQLEECSDERSEGRPQQSDRRPRRCHLGATVAPA